MARADRRRQNDGVQPSRMERLSMLDEAVSSLFERFSRTLLSALGTVIGVAVLVAVLGLTATATSQIDSRFTDLAATEVTISQVPDPVQTRSMAFPDDFEQRVSRIDGVEDAGLTWTVPAESAAVRRPGPVGAGRNGDDSLQINVIAASPGALRVARARVAQGRLFDTFADSEAALVAVVGPSVATEAGVASETGNPSIIVGGTRFLVVGILDSVERHPELLNSIVVPITTARRLWGDPSGSNAPVGWVEVRRGAGQVVAQQLRSATSTIQPDRFEVIPPPDPRVLRGTINSDLQLLFLVLAVVCLIVGMVGIANTTFVTVMERIGEIGLRRALGARRRHVALQILVEAGVIGLMGGLVGVLLGLGVVIAVALGNDWTAILPSQLIYLGPLVGGATAVVAAVYPALRGAATEPIAALQVGAR